MGLRAEVRPPRFLADLRAAVTENLVLKVVSVVIALMFFGVVRGAGNVSRSLDVPLTFTLPTGDPGHHVLLTAPPGRVRVTLRGSPSVLGSLRPEALGVIQLDLREGTPRQVRLRPDLIEVPAGATFVSFSPDVIPLQWDVVVERTLPVRASVVGALPPRARVEHIEVDPASVHVRGAALYVDPMAAVHAEPIDATGLAVGRYERRISLEVPRAGVEYQDVHAVRVSFEVVLPVYERRFDRLPVTAVGPGRVQLRPPAVSVVVRGDPAVVDRLAPAEVVPFVDLGTLGAQRGPTPARVDVRPLPEGAAASARAPEEVLVVPLR